MKNKKKKGQDSPNVFSTDGANPLQDSLRDLLPPALLEGIGSEQRHTEADPEPELFLNPAAYKLHVRTEHKGRKGKTVTLVEKVEEIAEEDIAELCKDLKTHCGSGGSFSNTQILIQGNHKQKIIDFLRDMGFKTNAS